MATIKQIEITTVRFVFSDDEVKPVTITKEVTMEQPKPKAETKKRKSRSMYTDEMKADIISRYKAGEGPTAIARSLGCAKSTIVHIIHDAGATEGRTGQHLKKKPEPQPEQPEPV